MLMDNQKNIINNSLTPYSYRKYKIKNTLSTYSMKNKNKINDLEYNILSNIIDNDKILKNTLNKNFNDVLKALIQLRNNYQIKIIKEYLQLYERYNSLNYRTTYNKIEFYKYEKDFFFDADKFIQYNNDDYVVERLKNRGYVCTKNGTINKEIRKDKIVKMMGISSILFMTISDLCILINMKNTEKNIDDIFIYNYENSNNEWDKLKMICNNMICNLNMYNQFKSFSNNNFSLDLIEYNYYNEEFKIKKFLSMDFINRTIEWIQ